MTQELCVKRKFNLPKRQLFDAWSRPEIMRKWFYASDLHENCCSVENQFTTNGYYKITMHFQNDETVIQGKYLEINRYNSIVFTWSNSIVKDSKVSLQFRSLSPNTTELTLTHSQLPTHEVVQLHNQGWTKCLENLNIIANAFSEMNT